MPSKIWDKYNKIKEIESNNSNIKTYIASIQPIIKEIIPKNKEEYYIINERLAKLKEEGELNIYEIIEENERIYIVIDNNEEILSKIDKLILSDELDIKKEGIIQGHGRPITKEEIFDLFKMEKSMCKISFQTDKGEIGKGSGFFCEIDNFLIKYALFTNNHVLNESNIEIGKKINFECLELQKSFFYSPYYNKIKKEIKITEKRKVFTNKELDYTCIELFKSDGIIDYFKIEPKLYNNDKNDLNNNDIFILQFPNGNDLSFSYGKIKSIIDNKIIHNASTDNGSSGSPIIRRSKENYIIGLHFGGVKKNKNEYKYNLASSLDSILDNIKKQNNIINCIYIPDKDETKIDLLHNYTLDINDWDKARKNAYLEAKKDISEENIEIYINDKKIKFNYKYKIEGLKVIKVKFKFKKLLTYTNYMFHECSSLQLIDLSSFNTSNVNNMSNMFDGCSSLESIDLTSFNTANVNDMSYMFNECSSLQSIDLSSFNTSNVNDMTWMFCYCSSLKSIDLFSFNTNNVKNMSYMFSRCTSLKSIDLSSFNTANVNDMSNMLDGCSSLQSIDLSSFNTTDVNNMNRMFNKCSSLKAIDLSSFNTTNVKYMTWMFSNCSSLQYIDLSSFNTTNVINMTGMFCLCSSLKKEKIIIKNNNDKLLKEIERSLKK